MSRTFRTNPTKLQVKNQKKVKDGSRTKPAASCENNGSCAYCQSNRMHRHNKKLKHTSIDNGLHNVITDDG